MNRALRQNLLGVLGLRFMVLMHISRMLKLSRNGEQSGIGLPHSTTSRKEWRAVIRANP
jgi:hypothetical protein